MAVSFYILPSEYSRFDKKKVQTDVFVKGKFSNQRFFYRDSQIKLEFSFKNQQILLEEFAFKIIS